MKLRYSPTSPYVRKVCAVAIEAGLAGQIERILTNPWDENSDIGGDNPLGKVPALVLDSGDVLFDSPVICEYLDSLHRGPRLFPQDPDSRWRALREQAQADGILDATVLAFMENNRRPADLRWTDWVDFQLATVSRALDVFSAQIEGIGERVDIGTLSLACALGNVDFRLPELEWRAGRGALSSWYEAFATRASIRDTRPVAPA